MSGSNNEITNTGGPASSTEPSMEEILASIRRILKDEQSGQPPAPEAAPEDEEILVLEPSMVVKPADPGPAFEPMEPPPEEFAMANAEAIRADALPEDPPPHLIADPSDPDFPAVEDETLDLPPAGNFDPPSAENLDSPSAGAKQSMEEDPGPVVLTDTGIAGSAKEIFMSDDAQPNVQPPHGLVSDEASSAAASSIGSLIRSISSERAIAIGRPGLTLEDLVREELRPLLKSWLDSNLPALVERVVRAEIQRVVERTGI